jgi:hypothetical protein
MVHEVDLEQTTFKAFYNLLFKEFGGVDLASKKGLIRKTLSDIKLALRNKYEDDIMSAAVTTMEKKRDSFYYSYCTVCS